MLLTLGCTLLLAVQAPVVGQKLNGPITTPGGGVLNAYLSGDLAVYHARQDAPASALYTTKLTPGYPNQPLFADPAGVGGFETPPVSTVPGTAEEVLFRSSGVLRAIPADGSLGATPVFDDAPLFSRPTRLVPGGRYIVTFAGVGGPIHLYVARIDGAEPPRVLGGPFTSFGDPEVSADGSMIVFAARRTAGSGYEIFAVPVRGGALVSLSRGPLPFRNYLPRYGVSADGKRAVYLADVVANARHELFGVPTDGSLPPARLHPPLRAGESVGIYFELGAGGTYYHDPPFVISADGSQVTYVVLLHSRLRRFHLVQSPSGGGQLPRPLASWPWPTENNIDDGYSLGNLALDPTGRWIVFQQITVSDLPTGRGRLFSVWAKGGRPPIALSAGLGGAQAGLPAPDFDLPSFRITEDGSRVVFLLEQPSGTALEMYSVPIDGSAPATRLFQLPSQRSVLSYELLGASVVYLANPGTGAPFELFHVPVLGGTPLKLNAPLVSGGNVVAFRARAGEVLYIANQDAPGVMELYYSTFP